MAHRGEILTRIALPGSPSPAEEYAAEELRRHLHAMAGVGPQLRVSKSGPRGHDGPTVFINERNAAEAAGIKIDKLHLGPEAFHLETRGGNAYILGGGPRGVLYGVYEMLEMLGCRWFSPETAHVPRLPTVAIGPVSKTEAPAFECRDVFCWDCRDPVWWVRNRLNGQYSPVPEYMGGSVRYGGFVHTFCTLVPPAEFFAGHPEYFSLIDGVRRHNAAQLCLTNPDVLRIVIERVLARMREDPRATIFSVSQNDCYGYCECPSCMAVAREEGSQSGLMLRFVNAVAQATSREFPDKLIDTLAYMYTLEAPRRVRPHLNVRVRLCSIACCQGHAFGTCDHPESARFLKALKKWGRTTRQLYIWHYCTNFSNYPLPMPDLEEIHANLNLYHDQGVFGMFMQGMGEEGGGAESMALRGYLISRLMWNPRQALWPIVDEFLAAYYGGAAASVRKYLELFHKRVRENRSIHPSLGDPATHPLFDGNILSRADRTLQAGETAARGAGRRRVQLLRAGVSYARLARTKNTYHLKGDAFSGRDCTDQERELDRLVRLWRGAGIKHIRERALLPAKVKRLRNRLAAHKVVWLRSDEQSIAILPSLGGRILEWHCAGRQWLAPPDPDDHWTDYPANGGYCEFAIRGLYDYRAWSEAYQCRWQQDAAEVVLDLDDGLRLVRTYALQQSSLLIHSCLENRAAEPRDARWGASLQLLVPDWKQVSFADDGGEQRLGRGDLKPGLENARVLEGANLPHGQVCIDVKDARLTHRFDQRSTAQVILGRRKDKASMTLDLRTPEAPLAPGECISASQEIIVER